MYLVSILVPVYGAEQYIERCIRSLFDQTYLNIEYIFVDDCSPDRSVDIIRNISKEYPNREYWIKIICHKENRGLAAARNTAVEHANGLFISHVDSDDFLEKDAIRLLVEKQLEEDADLVSGYSIRHLLNKDILIVPPSFTTKEEWIKELLRTDHIYNHVIWGRLLRIDLYRNHNIKNKEGCNQGEDWQVLPQLAYYANKVSVIDDIVYHYDCTNENSMCRNNTKANLNSWLQDIASVKYMASFFKDKESYYAHISSNVIMKTMKSYLYLSAKYTEKEFFFQLLKEMSVYRNNYYAIGWDNPIKRTWDCWYLGKVLYLNIRTLVWKSIKSILK